MKSWITRFGMVAVLGSLVCGLVVAGCGGGEEEDADVTINNAAPAAPPAAPAPPEDGS
jgi:hypothetical protein